MKFITLVGQGVLFIAVFVGIVFGILWLFTESEIDAAEEHGISWAVKQEATATDCEKYVEWALTDQVKDYKDEWLRGCLKAVEQR